MFGEAKLRKRVSDLEETFARIEHAFKQLQVEWTETYDKFRQLHWRVAKRAKQLENAEAESAGEANQTPPGDLDAGDSALTSLTPKQLEAQRQVLARRSRNAAAARNGGD